MIRKKQRGTHHKRVGVYNTSCARWLIFLLLVVTSVTQAQNLINVKLAGGTPGTPTGAAVVGNSGDAWNYFANLGGRASGGGVVTNASLIKDATGATLA